MASVDVHRCRFLDFKRPYVTAMAFNLQSPGPKATPSKDLRLAVGRANGDIEIWDPRRWTVDITIPGAEGRAVEDLAWAGGNSPSEPFRLFSIGGSDMLTEWNLATGEALDNYGADAGVIWAIDISPDGKRLAAACETGSVVIFDISGGSVEYVKRLQSADTSLACLAWKGNHQVVAGGADARLRAWSVDSGRIVGTMKVDKIKRSKRSQESAVVWTVQVLKDRNEQIVTGDSNGFIKIWDGRTLTLQQSFQAHESDVLCLCTDATNETIFSSGLDQKIVCSRLTDPKHNRWTVMSSRVAHSHDIRDMAIYEARNASYLVSGGLECTFVVNSVQQFEDKPHHKIPLTRMQPAFKVSGENLLYEWCERAVKLWRFDAHQQKRFMLEVKSQGDEFVTCAAVSSTSATSLLLAVGTISTIRLYAISTSAETSAVESVEALSHLDTGAHMLEFVNPNSIVIVGNDPEEPLAIYDCSTQTLQELDEPAQMRTKASPLPYMNCIARIAVSSAGLLAVAKYNKCIELYNVATKSHVCSLPAVGETPTAISFRTPTELFVATVDNNVYEFDITRQALSSWSRQHSGRLPVQLTSQTDVCCGLFVDRARDSRMWLWGPSWLAYIDVSVPLPRAPRKKRRNSESGAESDSEASDGAVDDSTVQENGSNTKPFFLTRQYRPLFFAGGLFDSDILVAEMPPQTSTERPFWSNRHIKI